MNFRSLVVSVCVAAMAATLSAQLSPEQKNWGGSAVHYLMMKQEKADWEALKTDADAKAFIDLFWARRDPTPDTPVNELRQLVETRIAEADKRFRIGRTPGSQTDRGLAYVLFGEPSQIVNRVITPQGMRGSMSQFQRPTNVETWIYRNQAAVAVSGMTAFDVAFAFNDEKSAAEFELDGPSQQSFDQTALVIAKSVLKRPFLTAADLASPGQAESRLVALGLIVMADSTVAHDVLRRAQEGENFADLARRYSSHGSAQNGGYVGRVPFADLTEDFKVALAGKQPGAVVLITRGPSQFAVIRLLTDAEAAAADAAMVKPK